MLEDLLAEELVGVVGDAEALAELEIVQAGLFLDLAQGAGLDRFAGLLLAFGQVPDVVPVDEQVLALAVSNLSLSVWGLSSE